MRLVRFLLPVLLLLAWLAPVGQAADGAAAEKKHFLWRATAGKGLAYLLGTIHVGKKDLYPLDPIIEEAFKKSQVLVIEADMSEIDASTDLSRQLLRAATYPEDESVANHLSEKTRDRLAQFARRGQLAAGYRRFKPWMLMLMVTRAQLKQQGLDYALGIDNHFIAQARKLRKPIQALETAEFHMQVFSSLPEKLQEQLLFATLMQAGQSADLMEQTFAAWRTGDTTTIEEIATQQARDFPALRPVMDKVLDERNDEMTKKIDRLLQTGKTYFIAVGAGHLVGQRGIVEQLKRRNYRVEQM